MPLSIRPVLTITLASILALSACSKVSEDPRTLPQMVEVAVAGGSTSTSDRATAGLSRRACKVTLGSVSPARW